MKYRFDAEMKGTRIVDKIAKRILWNVYAEETAPEETVIPPNTEDPQINFEQLIAKARKEEKEKLYPRLKKAEDEVKLLTDTNNSNLLKLATLQQMYSELEAGDKSAETVKALNEQIATLTQEIVDIKASAPNVDSIREEIEKEFEVVMYVQEQLTANKDLILSIFKDEVFGATKEEVDVAIQKAIEKTETAKKELTPAPVPESAPPAHMGRPTPPVVSPNMQTTGGIQLDADAIRNMDPASKEYKELRQKLGLR